MSTNESETRARTMGWLPKDRYKGKPENWLPADDYLKRGEEILPILQHNNRDLTDQVTRIGGENAQLKAQLAAATEAIEGLKDFRSKVTKEAAVAQKTELTKAIVKARADNDVDAEVTLTEKLDEVRDVIKEAEKPKPTVIKEIPAAGEGPQLTAEAKAWMTANPWFGTDKRKTGYAAGLRDEWIASGKPLSTPEFFAYLDKEVGEMFDPNASRRNGNSKVEGSSNSGGDSGGGSQSEKSYADLPPEAKAQCEKDAAKLVGPNRAYKTKAEWQEVYVSQYDWS